MGMGGRRKGRRGVEGEMGRVEENMREWDSQDSGSTDRRARKEMS